MTDDTQDQRLIDAVAEIGQWKRLAIEQGVPMQVMAAARDLAIRAVLTARSVRDDPTLRERIEALHRPDSTGDWCDHCWTGPDAHGNGPSPEWPCATIRAVLAEHAPADDPTRQAAAQALRDAADDMDRMYRGGWKPGWEAPLPAGTGGAIDWLRARADRLAATPEDGA